MPNNPVSDDMQAAFLVCRWPLRHSIANLACSRLFPRRLMRAPASLYFDDAIAVDWQSNRGTGQQAVGHLATELGSTFAPPKHQPMSGSGDFLGLCYDFISLQLP